MFITKSDLFDILNDSVVALDVWSAADDLSEAQKTLMYVYGMIDALAEVAKKNDEVMQRFHGMPCFADNGDDIEAGFKEMAEREKKCEECGECAKREDEAADVAPERRGNWIDKMPILGAGDKFPMCSACGLTFDTKTNYCPNCGAKMEDEKWD